MSVRMGSGAHVYDADASWARVPDGLAIGDVSGIAVDASDRVYLFTRGKHPVMVFESDGAFVTAWGEGLWKRPHGAHVAHDGFLYLTDDHAHVVRKCTLDGRIVMEIGVPGHAAEYMGGEPFNRCTHTALSPSGDIYVADGYGNSRVHRFAPDGTLRGSWGAPGCDAGEFQIVHNIACDEDGRVYVADRENHRVQVFDEDGRYLTQWNNLHRPCGFALGPARERLCYIGEIGPATPTTRRIPNLGPRISIVDRDGGLVARLGDVRAGADPAQFIAPHGIAVDSRGDIYVGECAYTDWPRLFAGQDMPPSLTTIRKLTRIRN